MTVSRTELERTLEAMAPLALAESWDNVGYLIDPGAASWSHIFITIDLTDAALEEALAVGADFVLAYHPPIFQGLKRLRSSEPGERAVLEAVRRGLTVYSPHTALDAATGGMTEWLVDALGSGATAPIVPHRFDAAVGAGRLRTLDAAVPLSAAVERIKAHLGLTRVRLSDAGTREVRTFAVCPGAGGSVFEKLGPVDLILTGEMRHHDVLARQLRGASVVLTDHTNSERGYLPILAEKIAAAHPTLRVTVSHFDADPLVVV